MAYKRKLSTKRRSFKKRSFKKRRAPSKKRSSYKRRRVVSTKRKRGVVHRSVRRVTNNARYPDKAIMTMKMTWRAKLNSTLFVGADPDICAAALRWPMNNIYSPGTLGVSPAACCTPTLNASATSSYDGYTQMSTRYVYWRVRRMRFTIKLIQHSVNTVGGGPIWVAILPQSDYQRQSALTSWEQVLKQNHVKTTMVNYIAGERSMGSLSLTCTPGSIEQTPSYMYSSTLSCGASSTLPALVPCFTVYILQPDAVGTTYEMIISSAAEVEWLSAIVHPITAPTDPPAEGKEEKKDPLDEEEEEAGHFGLGGLAIVAPPTPAASAGAPAPTPHTCLNPSHPRVPHERVGTCV